jgi:hypothetical protein
MRIVHFEKGGVPGIAADDGSGWHGLTERESGFHKRRRCVDQKAIFRDPRAHRTVRWATKERCSPGLSGRGDTR